LVLETKLLFFLLKLHKLSTPKPQKAWYATGLIVVLEQGSEDG